MSPYAAMVWGALLVNASTRRVVLASSRHIGSSNSALQPAAFVQTAFSSTGSSSRTTATSSTNSARKYIKRNGVPKNSMAGARREIWGRGRSACSPSDASLAACGGIIPTSSWVRRQIQYPHQHHDRALSGRRKSSRRASRSLGAGVETQGDVSLATAGVEEATGDLAAEGMKVTLLSGFLGAGKTTLMRNVLRQARQERLSLAVIVNDMADVNIDAQLLALGGGDGKEADESGSFMTDGDVKSVIVNNDNDVSVAMEGGCICCTLRDELLLEVDKIARAGKHQHLIIESTGISDPTPVAEALVTGEVEETDSERERESERSFSLDTLVTVVDSTSFLNEVHEADYLQERGLEAGEEDTRTIADLLISQVEFANVVLLNKADLVAEAELDTLEAVVRRLNPAARVVRTVSSGVDLAEVLGTGDFDLEEASQAAGWLQMLNEQPSVESTSTDGVSSSLVDGDDKHLRDSPDRVRHDDNHDHVHSTYGIGSFTFRARTPFHPERLMGFVTEHLPSVLRSKGFLWLATRHDAAGVWNQAGGSFAIEYGGLWQDEYNDGDEEEKEDAEGSEGAEAGEVDSTAVLPAATGAGDGIVDSNGDMASSNLEHNELVFIGVGMDEDTLTTALKRCLMTEEEMAGGPTEWSQRFTDPFPPW